MTNLYEWQGKVGDNWAAEWQRTDRSFGTLNAELVARAARLTPDARAILDIGCGAGATSFAIASALPDASVRGVDISSALVARANERASGAPQCVFVEADASCWNDPGFRPDLLISRHGVMFFDDPVSAFASLAAAAAPGARLVFSCFRSRAENDWAAEIAALLPDLPSLPADAPGPFAFSDAARVADILARAGWQDATPEAFDFRYLTGAGPDPVADTVDFFTRIGPAAPVIRTLAGVDRTAFLDQLHALATRHLLGNTVTFAAAAWIWTARR